MFLQSLNFYLPHMSIFRLYDGIVNISRLVISLVFPQNFVLGMIPSAIFNIVFVPCVEILEGEHLTLTYICYICLTLDRRKKSSHDFLLKST